MHRVTLDQPKGDAMKKFYDIRGLLQSDQSGARVLPVSKAALYRMIAEGRFPKPRRLGKRSVWTTEDVNQWRAQWLEGTDV